MQSLAAEVVALEEKVLQVRSREIRLEKETARLKEGVQQAEQQLQSSRQDRASLQATIDMLQVCEPCLERCLCSLGSRNVTVFVRATPISWCGCRIQKRVGTNIRRFCYLEIFEVFGLRHTVQTGV